MHSTSRTKRSVFGSSLTLLAAAACAIGSIGVSVSPADAQGGAFRKGVARGENGAAARSRGFASNGEGGFAARRGGFAADGQGNGFAGRGGCASGASGAGCRGGGATWSEDGSVSARRGAEYSGESSSYSGSRAFDRDSDGNVTASRATDASGERGAYTGDSTLEDGVYNRGGTYTGSDGQSATVDSTYERGVGGSRSVTCVDASGAAVACP